jgi:hypothetical protein
MHAPCHLGRPQKLQRDQRASLHGLLFHKMPTRNPTPYLAVLERVADEIPVSPIFSRPRISTNDVQSA